MAVVATLSASDYANFTQKYSDKNIINNIYGKEYIILDTDVHNLSTLSGENPKILQLSLSDVNMISIKSHQQLTSWGQKIYLKSEEGYIAGSFTIKTDEVIKDLNSLSVAINIEYDKYEKSDDITSFDNYNSSRLIYTGIISDSNKTNSYQLTTQSHIERVSTFYSDSIFGIRTGSATLSPLPFNQRITKRVIKNPDGTINIIVDYVILVWSAGNSANTELSIGIITDKMVRANLAKNITFSIKANTVETTELEFQYNIDAFIENSEASRAAAKTYEMVTNEFLQTKETSNISDRMSYRLAKEVFDAFDKNRPIITFDLLNCEKYKIGDRERYLESGDQIMVLDQFGQYIGEELDENGELIPGVFEIIKIKNKWDGSFHKVITAKQINT